MFYKGCWMATFCKFEITNPVFFKIKALETASFVRMIDTCTYFIPSKLNNLVITNVVHSLPNKQYYMFNIRLYLTSL